MQRILQINIAGRVLPIEEDAYLILKDYIDSLKRQFAGEQGNDEIIHDIEARIAELFDIRLQNNVPAIDRTDVTKVIDTLGAASDMAGGSNNSFNKLPTPYMQPRNQQQQNQQQYNNPFQQGAGQRRIFRNPNDKLLGGVCSGLANYLDIDTTIVRLIWAACCLAGIPIIIYFVAWIIIPVPQTPQDFSYMKGGQPLNFHDITRNVGTELKDVKKRAESMSQELKDFFSKKK